MSVLTVEEEEWRRLLRNQQDQGTILARMQVELEGHLTDSARTTKDFYDFVMHPERGVIVKLAILEAAHVRLVSQVQFNGMEAAKVAGLADRVAVIENERKTEKATAAESRQWTWRNFIVPLAIILATLGLEWLIERTMS